MKHIKKLAGKTDKNANKGKSNDKKADVDFLKHDVESLKGCHPVALN